VTPEEFQAVLPAFKNVPVPQVQAMLTASDEAFNLDGRWGSQLDFYRAQWVAHMLVINGADGAPSLAVEANDVVTRTTANGTFSRSETLLVQQTFDEFYRTVWGQRYVNKARQVGMGGATA